MKFWHGFHTFLCLVILNEFWIILDYCHTGLIFLTAFLRLDRPPVSLNRSWILFNSLSPQTLSSLKSRGIFHIFLVFQGFETWLIFFFFVLKKISSLNWHQNWKDLKQMMEKTGSHRVYQLEFLTVCTTGRLPAAEELHRSLLPYRGGKDKANCDRIKLPYTLMSSGLLHFRKSQTGSEAFALLCFSATFSCYIPAPCANLVAIL